jgi:hypothetical protein
MNGVHVSSEARALLAESMRSELAKAGAIELEAIGSSMEPTVPGGSVLKVERISGSPAIDELVAFVPDRGALLCCHRVVGLDDAGRVLTRGDRHRSSDGFARPDQIVGVVRSFALGGREYALGPQLPRPRPSRYRAQRQRLARLLRRLRGT